ncbi:MAG: hypothetical protein M1436_01265, partial [Acidobacteria bacterium]|nr:hypothetical protein [Acidobacteriota bacterium]
LMGLRPAKGYEKASGQVAPVGQAIVLCGLPSSPQRRQTTKDDRLPHWFFDPASEDFRQTTENDGLPYHEGAL